jgi:translation initiation factor IF-3
MRIHRHKQRRSQLQIPSFKKNEAIKAEEVRLVTDSGAEVMPTSKAIEIAREAALDLIEVSPKANPPVCKIMDYGSFKYQKEKEAKKQRAAAKEVEVKGVRLSMRIGENDLNIRLNQALKFLKKGQKVRIEMMLRGREKAFRDRGREVMTDFVERINAEIEVRTETPVKHAGNKMHMIITKA